MAKKNRTVSREDQEQFLQFAFEKAYAKRMQQEGDYVSLTKGTMMEICREALRIVRQETLVQLQQDVAEQIKTFEGGLLEGLDEWGAAVKIAGAGDVALPKGTKFARCEGQASVFIVEQEPQVRTVHCSHYGNDREGNYRIALPYLIFGISFTAGGLANITVTASSRPVGTARDTVGHLTIGNIYKNPCLPGRTHRL